MTDEREFIAFVRQQMQSVWAIELLLVLRREPDRTWAPEALVRELRASTALVDEILLRFERSGLVTKMNEAAWRYAPANAVLAELSDELERTYRERPVAVINLVAAPRDPLQSLADAFKFKRGEP